jgi:hypothetical protein
MFPPLYFPVLGKVLEKGELKDGTVNVSPYLLW